MIEWQKEHGTETTLVVVVEVAMVVVLGFLKSFPKRAIGNVPLNPPDHTRRARDPGQLAFDHFD